MIDGNNDFRCDFCNQEQETLYEGWFRTSAAFNPCAEGTASAGLIQLRRVCHNCAKKAIDSGVACANKMP